MRLRLLGPIELVTDDGRVIIPRGIKQAGLIALLGVHLGESLSSERIIDEIWGADADATHVHVQISRLRRVLGKGSITTNGRSYRLDLPPDTVDVHRFAQLATQGRALLTAADAVAARSSLGEALELWRGEPFSGLDELSFVGPARARLCESREVTFEDRIEADLVLGRATLVVGELEEACQQNPLRERRWGQLMRALSGSGRQAEALRAFQTVRALLVDQLGVEPGPELRHVERLVLEQTESTGDGLAGAGTNTNTNTNTTPTTAPGRDGRESSGDTDTQRPTGTVTFLFTDLEGSTRQWEHAPAAMAEALNRYDALVDRVLVDHQGYVFSHTGDGVACAFASPIDALRASHALQLSIAAHPWGSTEMSTRMAVHTGSADERDGNYFGPPLNRTARLLEAAIGGQVLVSAVTEELVRDQLPAGFSLFDRGEYHLRDLARPERIFELDAAGLAAGRPLRTLRPRRTNIAPPSTSFVGRETEVQTVSTLVTNRGSRIVTLVGPGGAGKTRVALAAASAMTEAERFPDGVWLVELAPLSDPAQLVPAFASVLGLREVDPGVASTRHGIDRLKDYLGPKRVLLVVDNCEHLVSDIAPVVSDLVSGCPHLSILATSREGLGISGEQLWPIPPLPPESAAELFVDRAKSTAPGFELTVDAAPLISEICKRLDGLPLAIELAASRTRTFALPEILRRLDDRFRLLTGGSRVALPRQQTLRAVVDWSYDLLDDDERVVFNRLSVFAESCTLAGAEAVLADPEGPAHLDALAIDDILARLVDKSLVRPAHVGLHARYQLLQTLVHYGREKLAHSGESAEIRDRHARYYTELAASAAQVLRTSGQREWSALLEAELANLRAAMLWLTAREEHDGALGIAAHLGWFWWLSGRPREGIEWIDAGATAARPSPENLCLRAEAQIFKGFLLGFLGDYASGIATMRQGRELLADHDPLLTALGAHGESQLYVFAGDLAAASVALEIADKAVAASGDEWAAAVGELLRASVLFAEGRIDDCTPMLERSISYFRAADFAWGLTFALTQLGSAKLGKAEFAAAAALFEEAMIRTADNGFRAYHGMCMLLRARAAIGQGELQLAEQLLENAVHVGQELVLGWLEGEARVAQARLMLADGELDSAEQVLSLARQLVAHQPSLAGNVELALGHLHELRGAFETARDCHLTALRIARQIGDLRMTADALEGLVGSVVGLAGDATTEGERASIEGAAQMLGYVRAQRTSVGVASESEDSARIRGRLSTQLGLDDLERLEADGAGRELDALLVALVDRASGLETDHAAVPSTA